jgi:hypothetical protein
LVSHNFGQAIIFGNFRKENKEKEGRKKAK